ncbi:uncharacterized protein F4822DRAFT_356359 [Hypoxylon trugodes]|uniref:uncharacterized protein n=1 Tax=Hypoxylon trugodes TaxID=326681 RepID=UPI0021A05F0E|nr:uncharacterized protein F4822DRAFT_356359 [Hypoxylon trugodes]KAI1385862.1 hypothetical protein F4822DRAFT_356359 [Hypoxylon trugodes]
MSRQRPNFVQRFVPDTTRLFEFPNGTMSSAYGANGSVDPRSLGYESSDLNEITRRQMNEDIQAYRYDMDFCRNQLNAADLTPQETRTLQIRVLDCGHNIRHCQHRIQQLDAQARAPATAPAHNRFKAEAYRNSTATPTSTGAIKRQRIVKVADSDDDDGDDGEIADGPSGTPTTSIQRLGFWKCRLCTTAKFLDAGPNRVPSAPCKWPLKDVSKIFNHFLDMHTEHSPAERCRELGDALARNRGPFEYWLTRTRAQDLDDASMIDELITTLQSGFLPEFLRGLNRAAGAFPNTVSGAIRKSEASMA